MKPEDNIPPEAYWAIFSQNPVGHKIFQELSTLFYDVESYSRGDSHHTAYNEGKRAVLGHIINRMNESQEIINHEGS